MRDWLFYLLPSHKFEVAGCKGPTKFDPPAQLLDNLGTGFKIRTVQLFGFRNLFVEFVVAFASLIHLRNEVSPLQLVTSTQKRYIISNAFAKKVTMNGRIKVRYSQCAKIP